MRKINIKNIQKTVKELCVKANIDLRPDILAALKAGFRLEKNKEARKNLKAILENAKAAKAGQIAICQDTGMVLVRIEIGADVRIIGGSLEKAANGGVRDAYKKHCFRKSIVKDPLVRVNTKDNTPCVLYVRLTKGDKVRVTVSPKGFGSENKSRIKMFRPTSSVDDIKKFIIETVKEAGPEACPPFVIGVGIGGTFDKAAILAKEAILIPINRKNPVPHLAKLEKEILKDINRLKIGPMGLGGGTTALGVNILSYPTHIAGMPVAINISCHATRGATKII